jgi:hypothetical protein
MNLVILFLAIVAFTVALVLGVYEFGFTDGMRAFRQAVKEDAWERRKRS